MSFPSGTVKLAHGVGAALVTVSILVATIVVLLAIYGYTEAFRWDNLFVVLGACFKGFMLGLATSVLAVIAEALEGIALSQRAIAERKS